MKSPYFRHPQGEVLVALLDLGSQYFSLIIIYSFKPSSHVIYTWPCCHKAFEFEFRTCIPKLSNENSLNIEQCPDWFIFPAQVHKSYSKVLLL
jgi:hypothetical protein